MKYEDLYSDFLKEFSDEKDEIKKLAIKFSVDSNDGMHVIFGMVVVPFIIGLINAGEIKLIQKAFGFLERMATSQDTSICEVLEFTILEDFVSQGKTFLSLCKCYMGSETLACCQKIEQYMM